MRRLPLFPLLPVTRRAPRGHRAAAQAPRDSSRGRRPLLSSPSPLHRQGTPSSEARGRAPPGAAGPGRPCAHALASIRLEGRENVHDLHQRRHLLAVGTPVPPTPKSTATEGPSQTRKRKLRAQRTLCAPHARRRSGPRLMSTTPEGPHEPSDTGQARRAVRNVLGTAVAPGAWQEGGPSEERECEPQAVCSNPRPLTWVTEPLPCVSCCRGVSLPRPEQTQASKSPCGAPWDLVVSPRQRDLVPLLPGPSGGALLASEILFSCKVTAPLWVPTWPPSFNIPAFWCVIRVLCQVLGFGFLPFGSHSIP